MKRSLQLSLLGILCALLIGAAGQAHAKTTRRVSHAYEKVWPTTVRFLRIDEGLKIIEKDVDTGYVMFELAEEGHVFKGAMEIVRRKDSAGRDAVELILRIEDRPRYMEHGILERMLRKIKEELGQPKAAPEPKPEPKPQPKPEPDDT